MKQPIKSRSKAQKTKPILPELVQLEESVGNFMQYWGFKKIHGRIWAHLFTASRPLDTEELMKRLQVSKGLMSLAMRDLVEHSVIQQTSVGKHGSVFYTANEDLQDVITKVLKRREAKTLKSTQDVLEKMAKLKSTDLERHELDARKIRMVLNLTVSASGLLNFFIQQPECEGSEIFTGLTPG